jgi:type II secretory pathway pseudopilin PulG
MARKFPLPNASRRTKAATGFTFIEALVSAALFAVVIVAAVFPALIALAQADRVAAQHETANEIAANALADEEAALAYGSSIDDTSATSVIGGMTLTVTLTPASISGLHNVVVQVADSSGRTLSQIATMIGPPVPAPGASAPPGQP